MFDRGHQSPALNAAGFFSSKLTREVRILAIGSVIATPVRQPAEVDLGTVDEIDLERPSFIANKLSSRVDGPPIKCGAHSKSRREGSRIGDHLNPKCIGITSYRNAKSGHPG